MQPVPHMTNDEFRALGHQMVDFIADYWDALERRPEKFPVLSQSKPGDILNALPTTPPMHAQPWSIPTKTESQIAHADPSHSMPAELSRLIMPGITHWQHPHFYAYFPANATGPSVLAELLSAGLGVQGMLWATSPACTELETRMLDCLGAMIGLPAEFLSTSANGGGVIEGTASDAALVAMVAARQRALRAGTGKELVAYTSTQAHSSIVKAAMIAGIATGPDDRTHVRLIEVDEQFRMRPDALEAAMREDVAAGRTPFLVCATVGTTGCTAIDPLLDIAAVIARTTASLRLSVSSSLPPWLHIDAAHAGAACVCPEYQHWLAGVGHADSICFNPHKWLLTNFDCNCFWTRDRATLTSALSITPEYLRNSASDAGAVIDYRDWQVPLGRRFRSLKLWFVIRHYGVEGLRAHIRAHMAMAADFEAWVRDDARFEVVAPRTMNLVCFRLRALPGQAGAQRDAMNQRLLSRLNESGRLYLSHAVLPGVGFTLRMSIGAVRTQPEHVRGAWEWIREEAARATLTA